MYLITLTPFFNLGTNLLPPELDFFNQAPLPNNTNENSSEDESLEDTTNSSQQNTNASKQSGAVVDGGRLQTTVGGVRKSASNTSATSKNRALASAVKKTTSPRKDISSSTSEKKLPASVQALKKKYTEQRLARSVFTKNLQPASRRTRSQTNETSAKDKLRSKKSGLMKPLARESAKRESSRSATRTSSTLASKQNANTNRRQPKQEEARRSARVKVVAKAISTRKPSAAAIVARRKTRMATLTTAASNRVSRMLSRLTPRGTSSAKFVKSTLRKNLPMDRQRSLRGRDISLSSEEEEEEDGGDGSEEDEEDNNDRQKASEKESKNESKSSTQGTKKKLKSRTHLVGAKKKSEESEDEDADEETSSRESSRRPSKQEGREINSATNSPASKRHKKDNCDEVNKKKKNDASHASKSSSLLASSKHKRDQRSVSRDSSGSKDSSRSDRPSRKTKEAATVYLNMLGQKLLSNKKEDDSISIESFSETAQEKRLEELGVESSKKKKNKKVASDVDSEASRGDSNKKKNGLKQQKAPEGNKHKKKSSTNNSLKELQDLLLQEAKKKIASAPGSPATVGNNAIGMIAGGLSKNDSDTGDSDERITISQRTGYIQVKPRKSTDQQQDQQLHQISHTFETKGQITSFGNIIPSQICQQAVLLGAGNRRLSNEGRTTTPPRKILPKTSDQFIDSKAISSNSSPNATRPHLPVGVMGAALSSSRISTPVATASQSKMSLGNSAGAIGSAIPVLPIITGAIHGIATQVSTSQQPTKQGVSLTQPLVINTSLPGNMGTSKIVNQTVNMATLNTSTSNSVPTAVQIATPSIIMSANGIRMPIQVGPTQVPLQIRPCTSTTTGTTIPTGTVTPIQGVPIIMPSGQIALPTCNIIQPVVSHTTSITNATLNAIATTSAPIISSQQQKQKQPSSVSKSHNTPISSNPPSTLHQSTVTQTSSMTKKPTVKVKHQQSNSNLSTAASTKTQPVTPSLSSVPSSSKLSKTSSTTSVGNVTSTLSTIAKGSTDVTVINKQPLVSPGPPVLSPQMKQKQLQQQQTNKNIKSSSSHSAEVSTSDVVSHSAPVTLPQPPPILTPSGLPVPSGAVIRSVAPKQQIMRTAQNSTKLNARANASTITSSSIRQPLPAPSSQANIIPQHQRPPISQQSNHPHLLQQNSHLHMQHLSPSAAFPASSNQHPQQIMSQQLHPQAHFIQSQYPNTTQGVLMQPLQNSPYSPQHTPNQQPMQYAYPNYAFQHMPSNPHHPQQVSIPNIQQKPQLPQHMMHQNPHPSEAKQRSMQPQQKTTTAHYSPQEQYHETMQLQQQPKNIPDQNIHRQQSSSLVSKRSKPFDIHSPEPHIDQQSTQPIKRQEQKQIMESVAAMIKQEKPKTLFSKSSSNSNLPTPTKHSPMPTSSSFRVDNEASPYAFEAEPLEIKPQLSYRKPSGNHHSTGHTSSNKNHGEKGKESSSHHRKGDTSKSKKEHHSHNMTHTKSHSKHHQQQTKERFLKNLPATVEVPDLGSSIPIPDELAAQLAEQAAAEGPNGNHETTYFIPLQSSSGQSFGVAVKLGTEGPPGPNQKVIMKAKLVTQPTGKPIGARVIGARSSAASNSPERLKDSEKVSPTAKKRQKTLSGNESGQKSSKTTKEVKTKSSYYDTSSSSSSSEAEVTSSGSNSSSSDSSDDESDTNAKEKTKKLKKSSSESPVTAPKGKLGRPKGSKNKKVIKEEQSPDISPNTSPVTDKKLSLEPTSCSTCLGKLETLDRFPRLGQHAHLIEAPVYRPTEKEFKDPMKYIERISKEAQTFGMCKIIPPSSFKPELNVNDDMRFTAYNQYVNRLMNRWGPNSREMAAIKKYLDTQNVTIKPNNHPLVGGVEIDLPALYHAVQDFGGLTEVIQRKKWGKIADFLRVPKGTQDRGNKLDDIYCKFLLPYDTLSPVEREELLRLVDEEWEERKKAKLRRLKREDKLKNGSDDEDDDDDEDEDSEMEDEDDDECTLKGKSTSLAAFFRVARNLMSMLFRNPNSPVGGVVAGGLSGTSNAANVVVDEEPPHVNEIEEEFWRLVMERDAHVQVQQGSIDTGTGSEGFGFPTSRGSSCGRHPWNLKILSNNVRSLLRCMGPVMGVTVPTLHVGMLYTTGCWYRDPHGLPWIEYNHTGAPKVWYGVPEEQSLAFYTAMKLLVPLFCHKKKIWLPSDTVMVSHVIFIICS